MTPKRSALPEVLAALTADGDPRLAEFWRVAVRPYEPPAKITKRVDVTDKGVATFDVIDGLDPLRCVALQRWAHASPADALAALVEARLIPEHWLDPERAPRGWCEACGGSGRRHAPGVTLPVPCFVCWDGMGHTAAPPSHPSLVAVASLGADALARAEAIVAETWRARVVWRVMGAAALNDHFSRKRDSRPPGAEVDAALVFALEDREEMGGDAWPTECPYAASTVRRAWPALRALAALGLHLVAVDDSLVTLAVEAL